MVVVVAAVVVVAVVVVGVSLSSPSLLLLFDILLLRSQSGSHGAPPRGNHAAVNAVSFDRVAQDVILSRVCQSEEES